MAAASRSTEVDVASLAGFLRSCSPFDVLDADELDRLSARAVVERYPAGSVVLDAFDVDVEELFVVWHGRVDIWVHPDRLTELPDETRGAGGLVGFVAAITGVPAGLRAAAVGDATIIRLPADVVAPVFASRRGAVLGPGSALDELAQGPGPHLHARRRPDRARPGDR